MGWFNWLESLGIDIIKRGQVPQHVAFIMDGNRRFARKMHMGTVLQGHTMGFEKLRETLEWCMRLDVKMVTVYAFSIENFKRPSSEVDGLMHLAKEKFMKLLEKNDLIQKHGICVRILGDVTLLPKDLQAVIGRVVNLSRHNTSAILNVCFAYTSRQEIVQSIQDINEGVRSGLLQHSDVSERLIERCLYTEDAPPPDLLVRSSGEVRLSDFLLWQSAYTCLHFTTVLWPEFGLWDLLKCILHYQQGFSEIQRARHENAQALSQKQQIADLEEARERSKQTSTTVNVSQVQHERQQRCSLFLETLRRRRRHFFEQLCPEACM